MIGKSQSRFTKGTSHQTNLITFHKKMTSACWHRKSSGCCLAGLQWSVCHCFPQPTPGQNGKQWYMRGEQWMLS